MDSIMNWLKERYGILYPYIHPPWNSPIPRRTLLDGKPITVIQRNTKQLWEEKGWNLVEGVLKGYYRTKYRSFRGKIEKPFSSNAKYFIFNPPFQVLEGPHGPCFKERERGCFEIHWFEYPDSVNIGIIKVERCILEALDYEY